MNDLLYTLPLPSSVATFIHLSRGFFIVILLFLHVCLAYLSHGVSLSLM